MSHEWNLDVVRAHHIAMQKKPLSYNDAISLRDEALANASKSEHLLLPSNCTRTNSPLAITVIDV